jgi:hypothetical protein
MTTPAPFSGPVGVGFIGVGVISDLASTLMMKLIDACRERIFSRK